ncbi:MAG: hypothetical protein COW67_13125 [Flavobacteriales bacterium CG18_big_fil_WC_8_21_14_2_50_32_9]|nr:MAG: hypothetical protein COW67_13125 [Flavobacteriales bacterium CG18_big_fil_WC_8_21_14_2_50_32_9]
MLGLYTKKHVEKRLDEQFDVIIDYIDSIESSMRKDLDKINDLFDDVLVKSTELMKALSAEIDKAQKPKVSIEVAKRAKK